MIFDCGPTLEERVNARRQRLAQWHPFLVLWPRRIGGKCVWLHIVRRKLRLERDYYAGGYSAYPEYRLSLKDELKMPQS